MVGSTAAPSHRRFQKPYVNLPSCGWYFAKYDATYWGGTPFTTLLMMRDADDVGQCLAMTRYMPRVNFKKEGLFDPTPAIVPRHDRRELRRMDGL